MSWTLPKEVFSEFAINTEKWNFIETGTHRGGGVKLALELNFKTIFSCEIDLSNFNYSVEKFGNSPQVEIHLESSENFLRGVLPELSGPTVFWLDAHGDQSTPILEELKIIGEFGDPKIILIDDIRLFRSQSLWAKGLPLDLVEEKIKMMGGGVEFKNSRLYENDILCSLCP